jgi:hypothetical protein
VNGIDVELSADAINSALRPALSALGAVDRDSAPTAFSIQVLDIVGGHISAIHVFLDRRNSNRSVSPLPGKHEPPELGHPAGELRA